MGLPMNFYEYVQKRKINKLFALPLHSTQISPNRLMSTVPKQTNIIIAKQLMRWCEPEFLNTADTTF